MPLARSQPRNVRNGDRTHGEADARPGDGGVDNPPIVLALSDLIQDRNGEVVLFNDSGLRCLGISTEVAVVAEGEAEQHRTAAGEDVSGFRYITFDNGLTLFYQPGLELMVVRDDSGSS